MSNMTLSVPDELHKKMKEHSEIKWSDVARKAFEKKLEQVEMMEKVLFESELTEEDAEEIGHKLKAEMRKRFNQ